MSQQPAIPHLSFEEWLEHEAVATEKHELVGGVLYAMSGALRRHNLLADAFQALLREAARTTDCRSYRADMALRVSLTEAYYPDVMVVCGEPVDQRYEVAPCLIVEVLSPSTAAIDHREKYTAYTRLPSLLAYIVAEPDTVRLEVHRKGTAGRWRTDVLAHGDNLMLGCPPLDVDLDDLYEGVR